MSEAQTDAQQMARLLVFAGFPAAQCEAAVRRHYPELDVRALIDEAIEHRDNFARELDEAIAENDEAAQQAEHNLGRTMHIPPPER